MQLTLRETLSVTGFKLSTRPSGCYYRFKDVEIRAGMSNLPNKFKGKLKINEVVGFYRGPACKEAQIITINFGRSVMAKYITIQHIGNQANYLEVNEVTMITGKSLLNDNQGVGWIIKTSHAHRLPTP